VLGVLTQAEFLSEIIVIDDGSTDNTEEVVSRFEEVKLLKNSTNQGKAQAMQQGVDNTDADILFFCDADLKGLTVEIIRQIIQPVAERKYDMYIGVRNNVMQKALTLFALNSGERAVRRELWNKLPEHFKYRYRIEAGLNFIARRRTNGYGWQKFGYYQTLKEKKYGFLKGTILRWWMNIDVAYAYLLTIFQRLKR
jgi:glycosyltransferase involved in cell wall biosynthesis